MRMRAVADGRGYSLTARAVGSAVDGAAGDGEKIGEQLVAVLCEHRLGMKLHAEHRARCVVLERHDGAVVSRASRDANVRPAAACSSTTSE